MKGIEKMVVFLDEHFIERDIKCGDCRKFIQAKARELLAKERAQAVQTRLNDPLRNTLWDYVHELEDNGKYHTCSSDIVYDLVGILIKVEGPKNHTIKMCPYYGANILSNEVCPGSVNTRHCPDGTDEDCSMIIHAPASEEQAQKPTAPAGLVEELEKEMGSCQCVTCQKTRGILSHYQPSTAPASEAALSGLVEELEALLVKSEEPNTFISWEYAIEATVRKYRRNICAK